MPALMAESGACRRGDQMLRGLGHVVKHFALEELWQNPLRGGATSWRHAILKAPILKLSTVQRESCVFTPVNILVLSEGNCGLTWPNESIRPVEARFQAFSGCQFQGMSSSMRLIL
jgi:hypothetical protein